MEDYWPPVSFADTEHNISNKNITMAIVIAPDYRTPIPGDCNVEYRSHIHQYLTDAGILQKSLSSAQEHVMELKDVLTKRCINLS